MPIRHADIKVGQTYRFFGYNGHELKPRVVTSYDPNHMLAGGMVRARTNATRFNETFAGDFFIEHAALNQQEKP